MILQSFEVGPFMSNCYVVGDEATGAGLVIDPGAEGQRILQAVKAKKLSIEYVVITHAHIDHIGATREVVDGAHAKLALHEAEGGTAFASLAKAQARAFLGETIGDMPKPDWDLKDGDTISVGQLRFKVLHTPGHSAGGISLYGNGIVFTGDTLFNGSIGRTDLPGCSFEAIADSIKTRLYTLPDETVVYPGHGPSSTIGAEKRSNPFVRG